MHSALQLLLTLIEKLVRNHEDLGNLKQLLNYVVCNRIYVPCSQHSLSTFFSDRSECIYIEMTSLSNF